MIKKDTEKCLEVSKTCKERELPPFAENMCDGSQSLMAFGRAGGFPSERRQIISFRYLCVAFRVSKNSFFFLVDDMTNKMYFSIARCSLDALVVQR